LAMTRSEGRWASSYLDWDPDLHMHVECRQCLSQRKRGRVKARKSLCIRHQQMAKKTKELASLPKWVRFELKLKHILTVTHEFKVMASLFFGYTRQGDIYP
jgi:hypothetical protein